MHKNKQERQKWIEGTSSKVATNASNLLAGLLLIQKHGVEGASKRLDELKSQDKQPHEILGTDEVKNDDGYDF